MPAVRTAPLTRAGAVRLNRARGVRLSRTRVVRPVTAIGGAGRRMERCPRSYHAMSRELAGVRSGCYCRLAVIFGIPERGIRARGMLVLRLLGRWLNVLFVLRGYFSGGRLSLDAARAAIEGNVIIHDRRVDHRPIDVSRVNDGRVDVHHGRVIREDAAIPTSADESHTAVSKAVVNAAIEPDVRAPVSAVPQIRAAAPAPIPGRPEHSDGRYHPGAGHPIVASIAISPIARRPKIAGPRANRLRINRQYWRTDMHGYPHRNLRRRRSRQSQQQSRNHQDIDNVGLTHKHPPNRN